MVKKILNIIKYFNFRSLIYNFYLFPFKVAIKFPLFISRNLKFLEISRGSIIINARKISIGMIKLGYDCAGIIDGRYERSIFQISKGGGLEVCGSLNLSSGTRLVIGGEGRIKTNSNVCVTGRSSFICYDYIEIGKDVLISWDCMFMDTDFHKIKKNGEITNNNKPIIIGNHVWIGCGCVILKGTIIPNDVVIAAKSVVTRKLDIGNCIYGGNPVCVIKENIEWEG